MEYAETRGATGGVPQEERVPKVYLTVPTEPYVREVAKRDGTTFNEVKVPAHAEIGGKPLGNGWVFNPLFVDESRYSSAMSVIPLLADREVRLSRSVLDAEGRPVLREDGRREKETLAVSPAQIKEALTEARKRYSEERAPGRQGPLRAGGGGEGRRRRAWRGAAPRALSPVSRDRRTR